LNSKAATAEHKPSARFRRKLAYRRERLAKRGAALEGGVPRAYKGSRGANGERIRDSGI